MFDIAFSELIIIGLVALIVIGPERLPKVARTIGTVTGRMQRYIAQVKDEINREARFDALQQLQQEIQTTAHLTQQKIETTAAELASLEPIETDRQDTKLGMQDPVPEKVSEKNR